MIPGQEYVLMAIRKEDAGEIVAQSSGIVLAPLPDGTYLLDIQAYWHADGPDGTFRGGAAGFKASLAEQEASAS